MRRLVVRRSGCPCLDVFAGEGPGLVPEPPNFVLGWRRTAPGKEWRYRYA